MKRIIVLLAVLALAGTAGASVVYDDWYTYQDYQIEGWAHMAVRNDRYDAALVSVTWAGGNLADWPVRYEADLPLPAVAPNVSRAWAQYETQCAGTVPALIRITWDDGGYRELTGNVPAVPEPGGFLALFGGVGSLLLFRRTRVRSGAGERGGHSVR